MIQLRCILILACIMILTACGTGNGTANIAEKHNAYVGLINFVHGHLSSSLYRYFDAVGEGA